MTKTRTASAPDTGSVSVELVVFATPTLILFTLFVVFCGRSAAAAIDVHAGAAAAARAAADTTTSSQAHRAAADALTATPWACTASVDTGALHIGGSVTVTVDCQVPLADLGLPGAASRTVHATATEPIDTYRAVP